MKLLSCHQGFVYRVTGRLTTIEDFGELEEARRQAQTFVISEFDCHPIVMKAIDQIHDWCVILPDRERLQMWLDMSGNGALCPTKSHLPVASAAWLSHWNKHTRWTH